MITGEQVKAARMLLAWDIATLANTALVAQSAIAEIEAGLYAPNLPLALLRQALEQAGVEFPDTKTVTLRAIARSGNAVDRRG